MVFNGPRAKRSIATYVTEREKYEDFSKKTYMYISIFTYINMNIYIHTHLLIDIAMYIFNIHTYIIIYIFLSALKKKKHMSISIDMYLYIYIYVYIHTKHRSISVFDHSISDISEDVMLQITMLLLLSALLVGLGWLLWCLSRRWT